MMSGGRILITGAAQRLGRAMAIAIAARGWDVAVHYRSNPAEAEATVAAIAEQGGRAEIVQADLSDMGQTSALVDKAAQALQGPLSALVNNASLFEDDTIQGMTQQSWDQHMRVNLQAPILLSQAFAAQLPDDQTGAIVNMIDQRVWKLTPQFFSYTLSKSALWTATRTMAQALAPAIRVNAIGPGPTLQNARQDASDFETQQNATLTGRGSSPDEIVRALIFLLEADAVTGQMIAADGGQHLIWRTPDVDGVKE